MRTSPVRWLIVIHVNDFEISSFLLRKTKGKKKLQLGCQYVVLKIPLPPPPSKPPTFAKPCPLSWADNKAMHTA